MGKAGRLPFTPEFVGSDWHGDVQADVVAVNWREAQVLVGEAKWGDEAIRLDVYKSLRERSERVLARMPGANPWKPHWALFDRRAFTAPVVAAAKRDGARLVTFAQIVSDLGARLKPMRGCLD